jgi:mono/diheme cytochrome c family protein
MRTIIATIAATLAVLLIGLLGLVWAGVYPVGADQPHSRPVHWLLDTLRARSIQRAAAAITVPDDLADPARMRRGAGNYDAMCVDCHLRPGLDSSELQRGLSPRPPALAAHPPMDPAAAFWVIRHGIKASGMPAWGPSMDDAYIWDMVALLQRLPALDATGYHALVEASDGHSHGGGEGHTHSGHDGHGHDGHEHDGPGHGGHGHGGHGHDDSQDDHGSTDSTNNPSDHGHHSAPSRSEQRTGKADRGHVHRDGSRHDH